MTMKMECKSKTFTFLKIASIQCLTNSDRKPTLIQCAIQILLHEAAEMLTWPGLSTTSFD